MPKIDLDSIEQTNRTGYPQPYSAAMDKRLYRRLATAARLEDFGASHVVLKPGGISSQRHWHELEDELVIMLDGEAVLIEDDCETLLCAGDCASFPKNVANGHHLINRSDQDCVFVAIGKAVGGDCHYPDIDLHYDSAKGEFRSKDSGRH